VSTSQKRDADIDRLLRAVLKPAPGGGPGDCPDAGVLAAFVEGGLTATEQAALDAHLVICGRCQEALAILSHDVPEEAEDAGAAPETRWFTWVRQPRLRWFVPIGAAATVAVVFFASRPLIAPEGEVPAGEVVQMAQAPQAPAQLPEAGLDTRREKSAAMPGKDESAGPDRPKEAERLLIGQVRDKKTVQPAAEMMAARVASEEKLAEPAALAPAAPQAAGAPLSSVAPRRDAESLEASLVTVSAPGGAVMWRFGAGGRLLRSADGGGSWQPQSSGATADLLAGAAPSQAVCWIVGAAGTVLLTTDGERWERRTFPLEIDLVAVAAPDSRTAVVTARDGRRFETRDAGLTWSLR
jgi:hypothetical protein